MIESKSGNSDISLERRVTSLNSRIEKLISSTIRPSFRILSTQSKLLDLMEEDSVQKDREEEIQSIENEIKELESQN